MLDHCVEADIDKAYEIMHHMSHMGYSADDIITNIFRSCKTHQMAEYVKLEFIKVSWINVIPMKADMINILSQWIILIL